MQIRSMNLAVDQRYTYRHGLRTPREEIAFTARPKIHSHSQIFRYGRSMFCLPHRPKFSDFFDLCLHWVSVVRDYTLLQAGGQVMPAILLLTVPFFLSSAIPERDQKDKYAIYYYLPPSDLKSYLRLFYVSIFFTM